ncbi:hypothetical protein ONZ45_g855 [Pleurotus djamor]|nr:hypothetical protein ONZ45_g855 [Pleurotus djamor]
MPTLNPPRARRHIVVAVCTGPELEVWKVEIYSMEPLEVFLSILEEGSMVTPINVSKQVMDDIFYVKPSIPSNICMSRI